MTQMKITDYKKLKVDQPRSSSINSRNTRAEAVNNPRILSNHDQVVLNKRL